MVLTHNSGPNYSNNLQSTAKITRGVLPIFTLVVLAFCLLAAVSLHASASLPLGTILIGDPVSCSSGLDWYYYSNGGQTYQNNCLGATISCPNAADIGLTFLFMNPAGIVPGVTKANGVIVIHSGGAGTTPSSSEEGDFQFADYYFGTLHYAIVELAWNTAWEQTQTSYTQGTYGNVQYAACRPATFLNYVSQYLYPLVSQGTNGNPAAGMCAQGGSAGSAAIAYSLAYYGTGSFLDNVELESGPVLSDIEQGCEVPNNFQVTVCGLTNYHGGQYGCQLGTGGSTWTLSPEYLTGANTGVGNWTNDLSCANANGSTTMTSSASNLRWLQQSLVDDGTNNPTFTYSSTAMSGWLCRSLYQQQSTQNCSQNYYTYEKYCPNNSSPEGRIFYAQIGSQNSPPNYNVYAVDTCSGPEGAAGGTVPARGQQGFNAITQDMQTYCTHRTH